MSRAIVYRPECTELTGNVKSGLLLSYLIDNTTPENNKLKATDQELTDALSTTINEVRSAKKKLGDIVEIKIEGLPASTIYYVDWKRVEAEVIKMGKNS